MTYPEGDMKYVWDGRGTVGSAATCSMTREEIVFSVRKMFRWFGDWPDVTIPTADVRVAERLWFGRCRFQSANRLIDGACFRPIGHREAFEVGLTRAAVPVVELSRRQKLRHEARSLWNQVRSGGRSRSRRHTT
jgi:hypothetical protein